MDKFFEKLNTANVIRCTTVAEGSLKKSLNGYQGVNTYEFFNKETTNGILWALTKKNDVHIFFSRGDAEC
jgi:hypothetical protein